MRRIATSLAAGTVAATAAAALLAAPATAATPANGDGTGPLRGARPVMTIEALKLHPWKTGGASGVAGAAAQGTWARYTKNGKKKVRLDIKLKDTAPKDGLSPAIGIKFPGQAEYFLFLWPGETSGEGILTYTATSVKVREAVGVPVSSNHFKTSRAGKKFKKLF
ncbi:hypothetical protein NE236_14440 [Actinoallomurus purpureus]|uniref:hypothetical protein n=1 Tax=Actinoallomurus purpureus TaxID=478114 RepID=UPI0020937428|nr:hypothetical protein [Actinoallomurus purpureus]MCO6006188.1 hypothetical protein [Actinoallomurus purpureus]